jgi:hypothetical protein
MNHTLMSSLMTASQQVARRGLEAERKRRVAFIAKEIDELSAPENMGVWGLRLALREYGYDVDACPDALRRRGVDA